MKKTVFVIIILLSLCICSCGKRHVVVEGKGPVIFSLYELESKSDCIIIGHKTREVRQEYFHETPYVLMSEFVVDQIISDSAGSLSEGSIILLAEGETYDEKSHTALHFLGYTNTNMKDSYLLFLCGPLTEEESGTVYYNITGLNPGVVSLGDDYKMVRYDSSPGDGRQHVDIEGDSYYCDIVDQIRTDAREKYMPK